MSMLPATISCGSPLPRPVAGVAVCLAQVNVELKFRLPDLGELGVVAISFFFFLFVSRQKIFQGQICSGENSFCLVQGAN